MNHICIHALEMQNSLVDEVAAAAASIASSEYDMTFTLLACETPPSSYEAEPAVCVGLSVNSNTGTSHACIGGQVRLIFHEFDGKYC